jgi:hypothetical protein
LFRLRAEGKMTMSMPVIDNTDVSAIGVYTSLDKEEVKRLTENDPAVQQGIFTYELLSCIGMQGDSLP